MAKDPTQCERIIQYIKDFGSITHLEAFSDLGIAGFTARMSDLRRKGYTFNQVPEQSKNRYGQKVSYIRYRLEEI